jgi:hypothetical protein
MHFALDVQGSNNPQHKKQSGALQQCQSGVTKKGGGQKNYTEEKKNKEFTEKERITLHS